MPRFRPAWLAALTNLVLSVGLIISPGGLPGPASTTGPASKAAMEAAGSAASKATGSAMVARGAAESTEPIRQDDESEARADGRLANGSIVVAQEFWAATVAREMRYRVFFPPGYVYERRDYPVLYMLHGVAGDSSEWEQLGLLDAADRLIADGTIDPFLIVLPDGGPNYWANHATGARWGDYVAEDVVPIVDRLYRTRPERAARAIGGLSMGGEGALRLAMLHADVFGIAAAHAPSLRTAYEQLSPGLQELYGEPDRWRSLSPYWLVGDGDAAERLVISLDVGEDDPWRQNTEALHERLRAYGIEHQFAVLEGEHDASYWEAHLDRFLGFYSRAFARLAAAE